MSGTIGLLERSLRRGGMVLVGEPFWRLEPPDQQTVEACFATSKDDLCSLPGLLGLFGELGWDVVEMVLADQECWGRYLVAQWLNIRRWLDANPDDELADQLRDELTTAPVRYAAYQREYQGWGVFALIQ